MNQDLAITPCGGAPIPTTEKFKPTISLNLKGYVPRFKESEERKTTQRLTRNYAVLEMAKLVDSCELTAQGWLTYFQGMGLIVHKPLLEVGLHLVKQWTSQNPDQALELLDYLIQQSPNSRTEFVPYYMAFWATHASNANFKRRYEILSTLLSEPLTYGCPNAFISMGFDIMLGLIKHELPEEVHGLRKALQAQNLVEKEGALYDCLHTPEIPFGICLLEKLGLEAPQASLQFLLMLMQKNNRAPELPTLFFIPCFTLLCRSLLKTALSNCTVGLIELLKDGTAIKQNDPELSRLIADLVKESCECQKIQEAAQILSLVKIENQDHLDFQIQEIAALETLILNQNFTAARAKLKSLLQIPISPALMQKLAELAVMLGDFLPEKAFKSLFSSPANPNTPESAFSEAPSFQEVVQSYLTHVPPNLNNLAKILILLDVSPHENLNVWINTITCFLIPTKKRRNLLQHQQLQKHMLEILGKKESLSFLFKGKHIASALKITRLAIEFEQLPLVVKLFEGCFARMKAGTPGKEILISLKETLEQAFALFKAQNFVAGAPLLANLGQLLAVLHDQPSLSISFIELCIHSKGSSSYPECLMQLRALLSKISRKDLHLLHSKFINSLNDADLPLEISRLPFLITTLNDYTSDLQAVWTGRPRINYILIAQAVTRLLRACQKNNCLVPSEFFKLGGKYLLLELDRCVPKHFHKESVLISILRGLIRSNLETLNLFQTCVAHRNIRNFISQEGYVTLLQTCFIQKFRSTMTKSPFKCDLEITKKTLLQVKAFLETAVESEPVKTPNQGKFWEKILLSAFTYSTLSNKSQPSQEFVHFLLNTPSNLSLIERRSLIILSIRKSLGLLKHVKSTQRRSLYEKLVIYMKELLNDMQKLNPEAQAQELLHFENAYKNFIASVPRTDADLGDRHLVIATLYLEETLKWPTPNDRIYFPCKELLEQLLQSNDCLGIDK
ncbi:MAG: hypothetical protein CK425_06550 [Parachlamydia sp.]|nr:MAG: hypothetical protein CK425_06550 [Parachlamydia sp.]